MYVNGLFSLAASALAVLAAAPVFAGSERPSVGLPVFAGLRSPGSGRAQPFLAPRATTAKLLYVSDFYGGDVLIYDQAGTNQAPIGRLTGFGAPGGLAVDGSGSLYVANQAASGSSPENVLVFPRGTTSPSETLDDTGYLPGDVAVGAAGTVFVANTFDVRYGAGNVAVYPPGKTKPAYYITDPAFNAVEGVAVDARGTLYVTAIDAKGKGHVLRFAPKSHGPGTDLGIAALAVGIALDAAGDIILGEGEVAVYPPGATSPSKVIATDGTCAYLALDRAENELWVAAASVEGFGYPGGKLHDTIVQGISEGNPPTGIATSPRANL